MIFDIVALFIIFGIITILAFSLIWTLGDDIEPSAGAGLTFIATLAVAGIMTSVFVHIDYKHDIYKKDCALKGGHIYKSTCVDHAPRKVHV